MSQIQTKYLANLAVTNAKIANATIDLTAKVLANGTQGQTLISGGASVPSWGVNTPKNYVVNSSFETNATTGWSLGTVGTLTNAIPTGAPTFGSGASGNLSIAIVSVSQLAGLYSLSYVSSAATTVGNMLASNALPIDSEDQAKVLTFKFYYSAFSGTANCNFSGTSSNSFGIAIWDVTNSSWLSSTANFSMTQGSGVGYATGTCQTNATTASLRFVIYNANASSGTATMYFDDFYLGPQTAPFGPAMTDWVSYTPTLTGFGTATSINFRSRRIGDSLEIYGSFTAGTVTAVTAIATLGYNGGNSNVTIDSTKIQSQIVGFAAQTGSGATFFHISTLAVPTTSTINFGLQQSTTSEQTPANANSIASSGGAFQLYAMLPIVGWSSNSTMSSDTDTRVIAARINSCTATITGTYSDVAFTTVTNDTNAGYVSPNYTIPVTGYYSFTGQILVSGTAALNNVTAIGLFNTTTSTTLEEITDVYGGAVTAAMGIDFNFQEIFLSAGTQIKIQVKSAITLPVISASATQNYLAISRRSGPSVIAASESVNLRYFSSSTTVTGSLATVVYTTKGWDTHSAMVLATGIITAVVSGKYQINASIAMTGTFALNSLLDMQIQQSGSASQISESKAYAGGIVTQMNTSIGDIFYLLAGDTIKVQVSNSATTPVIASTATQTWISMCRVGN
jgi:hypothetical protein